MLILMYGTRVIANLTFKIFTYGFAWGGLDGQVASDIQPSIMDATVGTDNQGLVGTRWDTSRPLP